MSVALKTALVMAAMEWPVSKFYGTVPPTTLWKRMLVAGTMAYVGVVLAQHFNGRK